MAILGPKRIASYFIDYFDRPPLVSQIRHEILADPSYVDASKIGFILCFICKLNKNKASHQVVYSSS